MIPALLMSTWTRGKRAPISSAADRIEAWEDRSAATTAVGEPVAPVISSDTFCPSTLRRATSTTVAPSRAKPSAVARPIPRVEPVMTHTRPDMSTCCDIALRQFAREPRHAFVEHGFQLGSHGLPGMGCPKSVSAAFHRQELRTLPCVGLFERCRFGERHRLVGCAMDEEPGNPDLPSSRRDIQPVGILLDVVEYIGIERQDLTGPRILNCEVTSPSPSPLVIGGPAIDS